MTRLKPTNKEIETWKRIYKEAQEDMKEEVNKLIDEFKEADDFYDNEIRDMDLNKEEVIEITIKMIKEELKLKLNGEQKQ